MPLEIPQISDQTYKEILKNALARIRTHNPEWTNFNESDPGVTVLELFAFMTESLLYRANLIPERNRRKFLTLLGVPMRPAAAAKGIVTFANERGPLETVTLSPDLELKAGQVPFRTLGGLDVLPVETRVYYKAQLTAEQEKSVADLYTKLYAPYQALGDLGFYQTTPLQPPLDPTNIEAVNLGQETVDGALWVALLARTQDRGKPQADGSFDLSAVRTAIGNKVLNLGVLPVIAENMRALLPQRTTQTQAQSALVFELPDVGASDVSNPRYKRLQASATANVLTEPGLVALRLPGATELDTWADDAEPLTAGVGDLPPSLEDTDDQKRVVTWIRIRLDQSGGSGLQANIGWVGGNAALVTQRAHVAAELLGAGTGEPDQTFTLVNRPVIKGTVKLLVGGELWQEIDDLLAAGSEVPVQNRRVPPGTPPPPPKPAKVFVVDRESGAIRFGDGARGARPPAGAEIRANYDYGGGRSGNVNIGAITKAPALSAGLKVTNPLPTWGGDEPETVAEAEKNIAAYLRHQDRLVTAVDFKEIVQGTPGVDIGRVEVLSLYDPRRGPDTAGTVSVLVLPRYDLAHPDAPQPDHLFLKLICDWLDPRRLVTTQVFVQGPQYKAIRLSVGVDVVPGRDFPTVRDAVNLALKRFLSPLTGGREGTGWPLDKTVLAKELWAEASRVDGVSFVNNLLLADEQGAEVDQVRMQHLELPWLTQVDTRQGEPEPLGSGGSDSGSTKRRIVPVPVIPKEC